ncbi:anti-sigma factor domain-containing protein [Kibdelosporangium persicum]|uniref:Regulator of SigK n=1 Tax=Kibdelosporangium persicum TaxID=2698649 RepID=A0ABX2FEW0_9PSEU|nr:anti-sigma factor [Kibdelosporangium persicum]NRN69924.1 Anti-sigma-K factor RskA [Kibdelosporangium persicum]
MNNDVHTLTGAYVLDALSEMERRAFEDHMAGCPACHQEVAELRETTVRLGTAAAAVPPPQLWHKVHAAIGNTRQLPPFSVNEPARLRSKRRASRVAVFAAAASILAAAGLGVGWMVTNNDLQDELAQSQTELSRLQALLSAPDSKVVKGDLQGGGTATAVLSPSRNAMVTMLRDAPPLSGTSVYQLWYVRDDGPPVPAGSLASSNGAIPSNDLTPAQGATKLAISVEPAAGATAPGPNIVAAISLV